MFFFIIICVKEFTMEELVQCEYCDTYIYLEDYDDHYEQCAENENISRVALLMETLSMTSSLTSSINSTIFNTLYVNDNDNNNNDEEYDDNEEFGDEENNIDGIIDGMAPSRQLSFNIYDPQNLQDVRNPVKNVDLVAPLISYDEIPAPDFYCTICQDKISENVRKTLCNHYYCAECIEPWLKELNKKCPICSANLEDLLITKLNEQKLNQLEDDDEDEYEEIKKEELE
jgi:hypothetical protein